LKIPKTQSKSTKPTTSKPNVIKVATKQHKQQLILKVDDIKNDNILTDKRERIADKQMTDFVITKKKGTPSKH
jgi:hypothetical protein